MKKVTCVRLEANEKQIQRCHESIRLVEVHIIELANVLNLVGNAVRLKIVYLLHAEKELCVCDISDVLQMNVSAISQHLRKLKDGDLVTAKKEGQTIYYSIKEDYRKTLSPIFRQINSLKKMELV